MSECRIVVASCPRYKPIQQVWLRALKAHWPDCPYPVSIISPEDDLGWNANLSRFLASVEEPLVLLFMDDSVIEKHQDGTCSENVAQVVELMMRRPDIAAVKLQAGGAAAPEIEFPEWDRVRQYDREHHPFKRTNLGGPAMYRREWLHRLTNQVMVVAGPERDQGRRGAIELEVTGTLLTEDEQSWPEKILAIHRPLPDGGGGRSLLACIGNDAVTDGRVRDIPLLRELCEGVPGIEAFL